MIMERTPRNRRVLSKLRGLGMSYYDEATDTWVEDAPYVEQPVQADTGVTYPAGSTPDVVTIPAGQTPQILNYDPGKIVQAGINLYKYVQARNSQGQVIYRPMPYYGNPYAANSIMQNPMLLLMIAAGAFLLLS